MKSLKEFITEGKNGIVSDLKVGDIIYIVNLKESNKPQSAKITKIYSHEILPKIEYRLDKEVFGCDILEYSVYNGETTGMSAKRIKNADPDKSPIYNGTMGSSKNVKKSLDVLFGKSKEEIQEMLSSTYADKIESLQKEAQELYNKYQSKQEEIQKYISKITLDMSE